MNQLKIYNLFGKTWIVFQVLSKCKVWLSFITFRPFISNVRFFGHLCQIRVRGFQISICPFTSLFWHIFFVCKLCCQINNHRAILGLTFHTFNTFCSKRSFKDLGRLSFQKFVATEALSLNTSCLSKLISCKRFLPRFCLHTERRRYKVASKTKNFFCSCWIIIGWFFWLVNYKQLRVVDTHIHNGILRRKSIFN